MWEEVGEGCEVPTQDFFMHPNPDVSSMAVTLLTADDMYVISKIWEQKDVHVGTDEEQLSEGVPTTMILYKWRILDRRIDELMQRVDNEDAELETVSILAEYQRARVEIAKLLNRPL